MSSNETDSPYGPALRRAEAAGDAVAGIIEDVFERLVTASRASRKDIDADLRATGRLIARNTQRQLAANLTLMRGLMAARSVPAVLRLQREFVQRQAEWAMRDWERMNAQALDLLSAARRPSGRPEGPDLAPPVSVSAPPPGEPEAGPPEPGPPEPGRS